MIIQFKLYITLHHYYNSYLNCIDRMGPASWCKGHMITTWPFSLTHSSLNHVISSHDTSLRYIHRFLMFSVTSCPVRKCIQSRMYLNIRLYLLLFLQIAIHGLQAWQIKVHQSLLYITGKKIKMQNKHDCQYKLAHMILGKFSLNGGFRKDQDRQLMSYNLWIRFQ